MTVRATSFKIGLLSIAAVIAGFAVAFVLGLRRAPTDSYHAYFDESVQGLDPGAAVKFRGVTVGRVGDIGVAPDRRHIDVELRIDRTDARRLALRELRPRLRASLVLQGVTGFKFVDLDLAAPDEAPPPVLDFTPAPLHIAVRPSLFEELGDDLARARRRVPRLFERALATLDRLDRLLDDVHDQDLPARLAAVLDGAGATLGETRRLLASVDRARLPARLAASAERLDLALGRADAVLAAIGGPDGLVASARRTSDIVGETGRSAQDSAFELERALRDLGEAARAMRDFLDEIDRDPDMLVKGRASSRAP